jgi:hypothetical protein
LRQTLNNYTTLSSWVYFGIINTTTTGINERGFCEIDIVNGTSNASSGNILTGLKFQASINTTSLSTNHSHYGNLLHDSLNKPIIYIFRDLSQNYYLYTLLAPNSQTDINIQSQVGTKFLLTNEGNSITPNGSTSGYTGTWTQVYTSSVESTLKYTTGDLTVEGQNLLIADNFPIIGYNNNNNKTSRDVGILYQRYQIDNNSGLGDIVSDTPYFIDSIPSQVTATSLQLILSTLSSNIDNYYLGWWIKIFSGNNTNQVRQIIRYNGSQHIATLSSAFTSQNPSNSDTVYLFNSSYIANYYDETLDTFSLSYTHADPGNGSLINTKNANLRLNHLYATDTTVSTNSSTGSIYTLGGISISNTYDAVSSTYGGTFTSSGGISIRKNLLVGNNIGLGTSGFTPQESIHIKKSTTLGDNNNNSSIRLENDHSAFSYIDFVESTSGNRYGILLDSINNIFSLTSTTTGVLPSLAKNALTINNMGYIGINSISTNSNVGYLGIIGGSTNNNDNTIASRILLNSNNSTNNPGTLQLFSGNVSSGNISMYSGNDSKAFNIDSNGLVTIYNTNPTRNNSSGSLLVSGGIVIQCTENSTSLTSGGALAVNGGAYIDKNLYIGGDLHIVGNLSASGSVTSPTVTFVNYSLCTLNEYFNNNLVVISNASIFSFGFSVFPTIIDVDCEVQFILPGRSNGFIRRGEVIISVSAYTDDTNVIILQNVIGVGIIGSNTALVKFQSTSLNLHYFQISCQYIQA